MKKPIREQRHRVRSTIATWAMLFAASGVLVACASPTPPPTALMAVSAAALADAGRMGGMECAPEQMRLATDKMEKARVAMAAEDHEQARRLASEAELDAQLAQAKCQSATALRAYMRIKDDGRVLREEMQRRQP